MIFQYFLLGLLGLCLVYVMALPRQALMLKAFVGVLLLAMLAFTIRPEWSTAAARLVGIGRGVDLLFYLSHLMLFFIAFRYYLRFREMEMKLTRLVRQLALDGARAAPQER